MLHQQGNVGAALAQRKYVDGNDVEPEVEVVAERSLANFVLEILVGGRDHTHVDIHARGPAHGLDLLLLEGAQDLGLGLERHVADFVEEQGAPVRNLELALARRGRSGERTLGVAEEFAFDQLLGNRGAVHFDEGTAAAQALLMDAPGHQFLARAVFAGDEDAAVAGRGLGDHAQKLLHRLALPDDLVLVLDLGLEGADFLFQLPAPQRVRNRKEDALEGERLLDEIRGAEPDCLDRGFDGAVAGDDDHGKVGINGLNSCQGLDAVDAGKPDVEQGQLVAIRFNRLDPGLTGLDGVDTISLVGQNA